ncbi:LysR substrate-binding domain-containing protein [Brevibacterium casei]|uniref:LysR family transcriptional regulator n=1 Tax=Brevibacterium casei TaxID=33889 RepID=A0AB34XM47_9MICO|nr:LysR substrate-binding domain-containing protein [Brevibacterium casei]KZE11159.1 LysR family transcriptional regulator [Brevibacterium casei]
MVHRFPITLTQLTYFVECAKTLNMTTASQELHIAQSAVSTAINQLEKALGAPLFVRQHSKGLVLTSAGESLLQETRQIFGLITDAVESIQAGQKEVRGTIVLACFKTIAPFLLPQLLGALEAEHPELTVEVVEGDHEECLAALRSGRAEIALNYDLTENDGIDDERVGTVRPHIIVGTDHRLAGRSEVRLAELDDDPLVLLDLPDSREYFLSILRSGKITPRVKHRSSSYETVRSMVAMGLGYSILNQRPRIAQTYTGERTTILEIADPAPSLHVVTSTLSRSGTTAKAQAVTAAARSILAEAAPE